MTNIAKLLEAFARPFDPAAKLKRLLRETRATDVELSPPAKSLSAHSVAGWQELSRDQYPSAQSDGSALRGWSPDSTGHMSFVQRCCPTLAKICEVREIEGWTCDISKVHGLLASKAPLNEFTSTDDLIRQMRPDLISDISEMSLRDTLAHPTLKALRGAENSTSTKTRDHLEVSTWDGRLFLMNGDGSHHFSAAKYIAAQLGQKVPITAKLRVTSINGDAVHQLRKDFDVFVISGSPEVRGQFEEAMKSMRSTWFIREMPTQLGGGVAIFLPKSDSRSRLAANAMREHGAQDLGAHLANMSMQPAPLFMRPDLAPSPAQSVARFTP